MTKVIWAMSVWAVLSLVALAAVIQVYGAP
jgi:hypothetical protein